MAYKSKSRLLQIWSKLPVTKTASGYCHLIHYLLQTPRESAEAYLEALVRIYPTIYLRELQALLAGDFNLAPRDVPSSPTIARLLTALRITRKKCVHVATERFSPYNRHCRQLFFQWRRKIDPSCVYFFDETSFNCETDNREYG